MDTRSGIPLFRSRSMTELYELNSSAATIPTVDCTANSPSAKASPIPTDLANEFLRALAMRTTSPELFAQRLVPSGSGYYLVFRRGLQVALQCQLGALEAFLRALWTPSARSRGR